MKITVTENMFKEQFVRMNRADNFSSAGLSALFEFLEDMEKDIGEEYELDVIALCLHFTESDIDTIAGDYGIDLLVYTDLEDQFNTVLDFLESQTTVIYSDKESGVILYQNF